MVRRPRHIQNSLSTGSGCALLALALVQAAGAQSPPVITRTWTETTRPPGPAPVLRGRLVERADRQEKECVADGVLCAPLIGLTIDGAKAISAADLAGTYETYLAHPVDINDLAVIAGRITDRYRAAGYFLSQAVVPRQNLASGIGRILVIEGRISEVRFEGPGSDSIKPFMRGVDAQPIANLHDIDRRLALAGDVPGLKVHSRVIPDSTDLAVNTLVLETEAQAFNVSVQADNRGVEAVGPVRTALSVSANSLLAPRDQLSVGVVTTPEDTHEFSGVDASYSYMFGNGGRLGISAGASRALDGQDVTTPSIGGDAVTGSIFYQQPLYQRHGAGLWLGANFDALHLRNDWSAGGGYRDELRVARAMLRGYQDKDGESASFLIQASFGLDTLGASDASPTGRSRIDAEATFSKVNFQTSYYRDLGRYMGVYAALYGQWSADPLLLSEEFAAGGASLGRAYDFGEITGDNGLGGVLELRAGFDPDLANISLLQGYAFYDMAQVWNIGAPDDAKELSLSSAGLGFRMDFDQWLSARAEFAKPLTHTPFETGDKDWRSFFALSAAY